MVHNGPEFQVSVLKKGGPNGWLGYIGDDLIPTQFILAGFLSFAL